MGQHGGKRKGAGAPRGNLNGLKHGRYSKQFAEIGALFARDPTIREVLLDLARRHDIKLQRSNEVAALLLTRLFQRARNIAATNDPPLPSGEGPGVRELSLPADAHAQDVINEAAIRAARRQIQQLARAAAKKKNLPQPNQNPGTTPETQSNAGGLRPYRPVGLSPE